MPLIYRQTLVLRVKGYSIRELAKITDSSASNVKTRIHRARAMLLKAFGEQAEGAGFERSCAGVSDQRAAVALPP